MSVGICPRFSPWLQDRIALEGRTSGAVLFACFLLCALSFLTFLFLANSGHDVVEEARLALCLHTLAYWGCHLVCVCRGGGGGGDVWGE